jgi:predicted enzyme related to lactoylglutathione lyase/GNAT superfamily N-acetyltransferase
MSLRWIREQPARWDADKKRVIGAAAAGIFDARYAASRPDDPLAGDWWRVECDGHPVGYGWLDAVWGDAEILLAVDPARQGEGIGTFVIDRLAEEAERRGLNYIYNIVRPTHPEAESLTRWLLARGFEIQPDGRLTRRAEPPARRPKPGAIGWIDLTIDAADTVRDFYQSVAGWTAEPVPMGGGSYADYMMKPADGGDPVAGICHARGPNLGLPPQWMIYIAVTDLKAALTAVRTHGGEVVRDGDSMAVARDPAGAFFALWQIGK